MAAMRTHSQMLRACGAFAVGALAGVGLLGIATIGVLLLLAAVGLALLLGGIRERDMPLVFAGAAAAFVAFGVVSLPYHPCRNGETLSDPPLPGQRSSCGGTHPAVYFVPAALALVAAVLMAARRRSD
jgi:hypothetical protein